MRVNQRGWTPIEDDPRWEEDGYYDQVKARADALAEWWSNLHHESEQGVWARQRAYEDGDYDGPEMPRRSWFDVGPEGDAEYQKEVDQIDTEIALFDHQRKVKDELQRAQMEFCETQLYELGARMMHPYEHHNEDERYMEYMERDRD